MKMLILIVSFLLIELMERIQSVKIEPMETMQKQVLLAQGHTRAPSARARLPDFS